MLVGRDRMEENPMPLNWKPSTVEAHEQLPRKRSGAAQDPQWEEIMHELMQGNPVIIEYRDQKERGSLARSVGRRAAHRGMKVDMRHAPDGGYMSVRKAEDIEPGGRRARRNG
jgi:hypothetical protein